MKCILSTALGLGLGLMTSFVTATAFADSESVALIEKNSNGGYTPAEYSSGETCLVYKNKVVRLRSLSADAKGASMTVRQEIPLTISNNIDQLIDLAAAEKETRGDGAICDGPSTTIRVHRAGARQGDAGVVLFTSGSCSPRLKREGPRSVALIALVDAYCPTTHDEK